MKASTPTEKKKQKVKTKLAPLSDAQLQSVPGVLGEISRERAKDYASADFDFDASQVAHSCPGFKAALEQPGLSVIAELKRSSPSQGSIAELDPVEAALAYEAGGAAALSVLTEPRHFGGSLGHIVQVRGASHLPILRKDFTVHPAQLAEAKAAGASAVLLIVAVVKAALASYLDLARRLELDVLTEVHDEAELELALGAGADIVGVNNRDLRTLEIDLDNAPKLIQKARETGFEGLLVAESGYKTQEDLASVKGLADAVLIGTSLAGSGDLQGALERLLKA